MLRERNVRQARLSKLKASNVHIVCYEIVFAIREKKTNEKKFPQTKNCAMAFYLYLNEIECLAKILQLLTSYSTEKNCCIKTWITWIWMLRRAFVDVIRWNMNEKDEKKIYVCVREM